MNMQAKVDPITKAVADNILGKLPKKSLVRCHDCKLDFTSQIVLDAHLQGARHAKQIRSKDIMATLQQTNIAFSKDEVTNGLKCNPCNVLLNSIQQLQTHLNGNRHKKKLAKGDWCGREIVSKSNVTLSQLNAIQQTANVATKMMSCSTCNKFFNSVSQYNVHMASQKHSDKVNHVPPKASKKRYYPYYKSTASTQTPSSSTPCYTTSMMSTQPISNNFVSAGYQNQNQYQQYQQYQQYSYENSQSKIHNYS